METELVRIAQSVAPGAEQIGETFKAIAFREDDLTDWHIELAPGACYVFVGVGDETSEELYLNLWDPTDDRVVKKKESPARVAMEWCVETPGRHRIQGKVTEGHGHYQVAVFINPNRGQPLGTTGNPEPTSFAPVAPAPDPAPPQLDQVILRQAKSEAAGAAQLGSFFTGTADKTDWYTALEKGKCYWFIGAGDDTIRELHLYLWNPNDERITANKAATNRVTVGHCPTVSGMFHFQAKVASGDGTYKVGLFAKAK